MRYRILFGMILAGFLGAALAADKIETVAETCNGCHGANGVSENPSVPSISGQHEFYLKKTLLDWKRGVRHSDTMESMIKDYSEAQIAELAAFYAIKPWTPVAQKVDPKLVALGREASRRCAGCHGVTGASHDGETPKLNGQWAEYVEMDALKFREGNVPVSDQRMIKAVKKMSVEELKAIAAYYASQGN
ncbi:MAG: c-type cytochrome [Gammaproteobacteria bacterium]|nr:c-type cytochrome [Gammaproteobacteria bacterium]